MTVRIGTAWKERRDGKSMTLSAAQWQALHSPFPSGFTLHGYDHVSLLVSLVYIPVSLNNLFHWEAPIYDRSQLPSFNKLFEENQIFTLYAC